MRNPPGLHDPRVLVGLFLAVVALAATLNSAAGATVPDGLSPAPISNARMSDSPDGPAITRFPSGTTVVYVIFDYEVESEEIRVKIMDNVGATILNHAALYRGTGSASLPAAPPGGFPDGPYITNWYRGGYLAITIFWEVTREAGRVTPTATPERPTGTPTSTPTDTPTSTPTGTATRTATPYDYRIYLPCVIKRR